MAFADQKPLRMRMISIGFLLFPLSCAHTNAEGLGGGGPPPGGRGGQVAPVGSGECSTYVSAHLFTILRKVFVWLVDQKSWALPMRWKMCCFWTMWQVFAPAYDDVQVYQEAHRHRQEDEEGRLHREKVGVETYTHTNIGLFDQSSHSRAHTRTHTCTNNSK